MEENITSPQNLTSDYVANMTGKDSPVPVLAMSYLMHKIGKYGFYLQ